MKDEANIIIYDGECAFCARAVRFIYRHDGEGRYRFASRQSEVGQRLRAMNGVGPEVESLVLVEGGSAYTHSTAVLRIAGRLGWPWKMAAVLLWVPRWLRDPVYGVISRLRKRLAGKACPLPPAGLRERCID